MQSASGTLSNQMTIVALINGMIGGIILVMPILALKTGSVMIAPVVLISGFFSYYSCLLCLKHLRNYKDLDQAVLKHFGNKRGFKIFYDVCISISLIVLLILYFDLICKQWSGLTSDSRLIPLINAIILFPVVYIMKKYHFGASLLAYGIISTIGYCLFLIYMWATTPSGPKQLVRFDKHFPQLAAALSQGFSIQAFFIPILKKNPNINKHKKILMITYVVGAIIYVFIGYGGALSIINRTFPGHTKPETITQYFNHDEWQVILLQIIYLVHLYSAYPQFLLISKKRFFSALEIPESNDVTFKQVIYVGIIILTCLIIKLTSLTAESLIQLNGSIISFIFITVIPVSLHIKCVYFSEAKQNDEPFQNQHQIKQKMYLLTQHRQSGKNYKNPSHEIQLEIPHNQQIQNKQSIDQGIINKKTQSEQAITSLNSRYNQSQCKCDIKYQSKLHQLGESILLIVMVVSGFMTMVYTLYLLYDDSLQEATL